MKNRIDILMIFVAAFLFFYTAIMAYVSDITPDEAYTYLAYANSNNPGFLNIDLANNHPLNSFLVYVSSFLLPFNEFAIRLPNILFLLVYLCGAIRISKICKPFSLFAFGALVFFWALLPDFFSQARGYGIATALTLFFCIRIKERKHNNTNFVTNLYILLVACYAYPGLLPLPLAFALYYVFFELKGKVMELIKTYFFDLLFQVVNFAFLGHFLLSVSAEGKPLFGAEKESFIEASLGWYLESFTAFDFNINEVILLILVILFLAGAVFLAIKKTKNSHIIFITIPTFLIFFGLSYALDKPYPTGRLLLPLYPLLILSIVEILKKILTIFSVNSKRIQIFSMAIFILLLINFLFQFELKNNYSDYKTRALRSLGNKGDEKDYGNSSLEFYRAKYLNSYPIKSFVKENSVVKFDLQNNLKGYYSRDKSILLLEANLNFDTRSRFYLHVTPLDKDLLLTESKDVNFDNFDFHWAGFKNKNLKYMAVSLPDYKIKSINIGQINADGRIWSTNIPFRKQ